MKISVVIPCYNVEQYIRQCVDVVLAQTHRDIEVILVDDGATDTTPQICDEYAALDKRIRVLHKPNGGLSDARNVGTFEATGEYLIYVDSDDKWDSVFFLERLVATAQQELPDMILFPQQRFRLDSDSPQTNYAKFEKSMFEGDYYQVLETLIKNQAYPVSAWSKMIRTHVLQSNRIEFKLGLLGEDMDWNQRLFPCLTSIGFCNDVCYMYRERKNSITTTFRLKNAEDFCCILETWQTEWLRSNNLQRELYLGYLAFLYVTLVYHYYLIPRKDRKVIRDRILSLSALLDYSITTKSARLRLLKNIFGAGVMLMFAGRIGQYRKRNRLC